MLSLQFPALREFVQMGKPVWGTCAGLIFLASKAIGEGLSVSLCELKFYAFHGYEDCNWQSRVNCIIIQSLQDKKLVGRNLLEVLIVQSTGTSLAVR